MTLGDKDKFLRLRKRIEYNYRLTHMYAQYLERYPEVISAEMIEALTEDGSITKEEALVAILCELFGLDFDGTMDERVLIREYITPSVRLLDAQKYRDNPYYKRIKIPNIRDGAWELKNESYAPYRAFIAGDMILGEDCFEVAPLGFFDEEFFFPAVLEDGNEWMTLTPVDLDTCDEAINEAHGRVITFGLGLGYYAFMASEKDEVESVTVVEKSEDVIRLFKKHILPQFSHPEKVTVINEDAFLYSEKTMPEGKFDLAFVDTWRDASDGLPMYLKMKALESKSPNTRFLYWIENFLISRKRAVAYAKILERYERGEYNSFEEILEDYLK